MGVVGARDWGRKGRGPAPCPTIINLDLPRVKCHQSLMLLAYTEGHS